MTLANLLWLLGYLAMVALVVSSLWSVRARMLPQLSTPQAQADWQAWREEARAQSEGEGPVKRRVPKSREPNSLVLLRDYFGTLVATALFFSSLLFGASMFLIRGALRSGEKQPEAGLASRARPV